MIYFSVERRTARGGALKCSGAVFDTFDTMDGGLTANEEIEWIEEHAHECTAVACCADWM
jgi:hypothetical protein